MIQKRKAITTHLPYLIGHALCLNWRNSTLNKTENVHYISVMKAIIYPMYVCEACELNAHFSGNVMQPK